jgi:hypothetical protein
MSTHTPDPHFYWKHAGQELRGLQDRITGYKHRFEDAGRKDIRADLEQAKGIESSMHAAGVIEGGQLGH